MSEMYIIVSAFTVIGAGLKYIDEAFDEGSFNRRFAATLAVILLLIWIGVSILDAISGTILLSVLAGVLITGKIDNTVFGASTAAIFGSLMLIEKSVFFLPLVILTASGVLDEKGNDYVDTHKTPRILSFFFLHRFTMKLALLGICLAGIFSILYFAAFLLFDIAYDTIGLMSRHRKVESITANKPVTEKGIPLSA